MLPSLDTVCSLACEFVVYCIKKLDPIVKACEPFYAALAAALVTLDAYVFFTSVLKSVRRSQGLLGVLMHSAIALWLLFCVLWNHAWCVFTPPGSTLQEDPQRLQTAMTFDWRWCKKCNRPKPPLAHHCSICKRCILKMDHHCPWMANCIGHYNYHYFFLYLFYMWVGAAYSVFMTYNHVPHVMHTRSSSWEGPSFLAFLTFLLAISVFLAMCGLLGWHVFLVLTGQGTIDAFSNYYEEKDACLAGEASNNPYNLGPMKNWQETFDAHGRLWWLTWALPSLQKKRGNGWLVPRTRLRSSRVTSMSERSV
mmetsp:Transcript_1828/g.4685  ORF Transcript_1828/g.4685 Transcript_1828/m.4685 type:complete len:309 (-) Transcript_1828:1236-2162(-)